MRSLLTGLIMAVVVSGPAAQTTMAAMNDEAMAKVIANELKESGRLKDYRVGVKYKDGVAWLSGTVTNQSQKQIAEKLVRNCSGVQHIVSKLEVEQIEAPAPEPKTIKKVAATGRPQGNNMPVPYARAGMGGVQNASYCPGGNCMPGGTMGPPAMGGGAHSPQAMGQAVSYDNPQMPGYAWPSYAASPNYAALTYPQQYSASAWPYIGPFYPYPQVPLGWRKVTLEWDDGWWFLDFKDCKHCK